MPLVAARSGEGPNLPRGGRVSTGGESFGPPSGPGWRRVGPFRTGGPAR